MKNPINVIYFASGKVLAKRSYKISLIIIAIFIMFALTLIPVLAIPGNSILFQLSIWGFKDYAVLVPLSFLMALMINMQVYNFGNIKSIKKQGGLFGVFPGVIAGVFGTASCSSCVAAIFVFLSAGSIVFLLEYQWHIVAGSVLLVLLSIYLTSISMERSCEACK